MWSRSGDVFTSKRVMGGGWGVYSLAPNYLQLHSIQIFYGVSHIGILGSRYFFPCFLSIGYILLLIEIVLDMTTVLRNSINHTAVVQTVPPTGNFDNQNYE